MMVVPAMWAVWGLLALTWLSLRIYTGRLSRDEDDQLVLDDSFERIRVEQAAIVARLKKIEPITRIVLILFCAMTLVVVVYYIFDMIHQFQ